MSWLVPMLVLAQAPAAPVDNGLAQILNMTPIILMAVIFFVVVWLPSSREQKKRQAQLAALKKNDRVFTSSGIIGTIANISADGKEVTLKVDDNTKLRVFRRVIEGLYADSGAAEQPPPA